MKYENCKKQVAFIDIMENLFILKLEIDKLKNIMLNEENQKIIENSEKTSHIKNISNSFDNINKIIEENFNGLNKTNLICHHLDKDDKIEMLENEINYLDEKNESYEEEIDRLLEEKKELEIQLNKVINEYEEKVKDLNNKIIDLEKEIKKIEEYDDKLINEYKNIISELNKAIEKIKKTEDI